MCTSLVRCWLKSFSAFFVLVGLALTGFFVWVDVHHGSLFTYLLTGITGYMIIIGVLGFCTVRGSNKCLSRTMIVMLALLVILEGVAAACLLFAQDQTLDFIKKLDKDSNDVATVEEFIRSHATVIQIGVLVFFGIQVFTLFTVGFCGSRLSRPFQHLPDDDYDQLEAASSQRGDGRKQPLLHDAETGSASAGSARVSDLYLDDDADSRGRPVNSDGHGQRGPTPEAGSARSRMVDKYGDRFRKSGGSQDLEFSSR